MTKYYFVAYTKVIQGIPHFCNDTVKEHPVRWIMEKCKRAQKFVYNLIFYKEITNMEYFVFHPEQKQEYCENCVGRKYPAGDYCQGCKLREYRS